MSRKRKTTHLNKEPDKKNAFEFLKDSGFIGSGNGKKNDSVEYKKQIIEAVVKKPHSKFLKPSEGEPE